MLTTSSSSRTRILTAYTAWWAIWITLQTLVLHQQGFDWRISLTDAALTHTVLSLSGYIINTTLRFYQPRQIARYIFTWSIGMALLSVWVQKFALAYFLGSDAGYLAFVQKSLFVRGAFDWLLLAFITITSWLWFYIGSRLENEKQQEQAAELAREAELTGLRTQLQPHFLFNSLNSISALIGTQPEQARTMIQQLSDFLRGTVRKDDRQQVTLAEELGHLRLYLDIEKIRFGHRLDTRIAADEPSLAAMIPALLLQPIVENAIKFGLYDTVDDITITISAVRKDHFLEIAVTNPFDPATAHPRKGTGFGLNSIQRRLYLLYSQNDLLSTSQRNGEFVTQLRIPQPA